MMRLLSGIVIGVVATACMTAWELPFYRRYGREGCLDWDINQHLVGRVNGKPPSANLAAGLVVHVVVGVVVGVGFVLCPWSGPRATGIGVALGVLLWMMLLALRKPITGLGPTDGRLGIRPAWISLVGHIVYGAVLGVLIQML